MNSALCALLGSAVLIASLSACAVPVRRTAYFISAPKGEPPCQAAVDAVRAYALAHGYQERATPVIAGIGRLPDQLARFVRKDTSWPFLHSALIVGCVEGRLNVTAMQQGDSGVPAAKAERQRLYEHLAGRFPQVRLTQRDYQGTFEIIPFAP